MAESEKPKLCCHPDCFHCPYPDCWWDEMLSRDYTESNKLDYFLHEDSTGRKYHKDTESAKEYSRSRRKAYVSENKERYSLYNKEYYKKNQDKIKERANERYDTSVNTVRCRMWREKNKKNRKEYNRRRYLENRDKILERTRERYYEKKRERDLEDGRQENVYEKNN